MTELTLNIIKLKKSLEANPDLENELKELLNLRFISIDFHDNWSFGRILHSGQYFNTNKIKHKRVLEICSELVKDIPELSVHFSGDIEFRNDNESKYIDNEFLNNKYLEETKETSQFIEFLPLDIYKHHKLFTKAINQIIKPSDFSKSVFNFNNWNLDFKIGSISYVYSDKKDIVIELLDTLNSLTDIEFTMNGNKDDGYKIFTEFYIDNGANERGNYL